MNGSTDDAVTYKAVLLAATIGGLITYTLRGVGFRYALPGEPERYVHVFERPATFKQHMEYITCQRQHTSPVD